MMIVGQISSPEEAKEMEFIVKNLVVGNRARVLADKINKGVLKDEKKKQRKNEF